MHAAPHWFIRTAGLTGIVAFALTACAPAPNTDLLTERVLSARLAATDPAIADLLTRHVEELDAEMLRLCGGECRTAADSPTPEASLAEVAETILASAPTLTDSSVPLVARHYVELALVSPTPPAPLPLTTTTEASVDAANALAWHRAADYILGTAASLLSGAEADAAETLRAYHRDILTELDPIAADTTVAPAGYEFTTDQPTALAVQAQTVAWWMNRAAEAHGDWRAYCINAAGRAAAAARPMLVLTGMSPSEAGFPVNDSAPEQ